MSTVIDWSEAVFEVSWYQTTSSSMKLFMDKLDKRFKPIENGLYSLAMTDGNCLFCGVALYFLDTDGVPHIVEGSWDHLIPASRFGLRTLGNLPLVCRGCNNRKDSKAPLEYWKERRSRGESLYIPRQAAFENFLERFATPYRKRFPELYEAAKNYVPGVTDDNELLVRHFLSRDPETGKAPLDFRDRWGGDRPKLPHDVIVERAQAVIRRRYPSEGGRTVVSIIGDLGEAWSERYDHEFSEGSRRDFQDFVYSTLYHSVVLDESLAFERQVLAFRTLASVEGRREFKVVANTTPSFRSFRARLSLG